MKRLALFLLFLAASLTVIPMVHAETVIFGVGFTDERTDGTRLVWTTSEPAICKVTLRWKNKVVREFKENASQRIHRAELYGLKTADTYDISIEAPNTVPCVVSYVPRAQRVRFDSYEDKTYFGVGHATDQDELKNLGAGMVRYSPTWDAVQPRAGTVSEKALDKMVADIRQLKAAGVEPLVLLAYGVDWAQTNTNKQLRWRNPHFGPPDNVSDWQVYVRAVMSRLKGLVHYYEVWNEPDAGYLADGKPLERNDVSEASGDKVFQGNNDYWLGDRYLPLIAAARQVANEVDKGISLIGPSWNHDYNGTRGDLLLQRGVASYLQQYSFHNYIGGPQSYARWEDATSRYFLNADRVFEKSLGKGKVPPIAVTEWGIQTYDNPPVGSGFSSRHDGQIFLLKSSFYYLSQRRVSLVILHQMGYDDPWSLVNHDAEGQVTHTPAYETYRWLCRTFNGQRYEILPIDTGKADNVRAIAVWLKDAKTVYVALWQDRLDSAQQEIVLPARPVTITLGKLGVGTFRRERLDESGATVKSDFITSRDGSFNWGEILPECNGKSESGVVVYRLLIATDSL